MTKAVIFGGTTEGRKLCELCAERGLPAIYCVATGDGARLVGALPHVDIRVGRLDAAEMTALLEQNEAALVLDATHPYAEDASGNILAACRSAGNPLLRIARESQKEQGCIYWNTTDDLLAWLAREPGNVFVTTGSSHAEAFTRLPDYRRRVWMRVLPSLDSLRFCLDWGYRPDRLICMQGPFSEELNRAMFQHANAGILVTKDSGATGGFLEKVRAARSLGMPTVVLSKPAAEGGISLEEARSRIMEINA